MARLRTLKPGFFTNELLAEVDPLGRLLFQGLWCVADREGRLADRPRRIKVETIPYDDCDVEALLDQLEQRGFIVRYAAGGERYIQIVNFRKHQTPHVKEAASTIPAPPGFIPPPDDPGHDEANVGLAPGLSGASPVLAPDKPQSNTRPAPLLLGSGNLVEGTGSVVAKATTQRAEPDAPSGTPKSNQRALFDVLVARFGQPANSAERGKFNKACKLFDEADCDSVEADLLIGVASERWGAVEITPVGVAGNVTSLRGPARTGNGKSNGTVNQNAANVMAALRNRKGTE